MKTLLSSDDVETKLTTSPSKLRISLPEVYIVLLAQHVYYLRNVYYLFAKCYPFANFFTNSWSIYGLSSPSITDSSALSGTKQRVRGRKRLTNALLVDTQ